MLRNVERDLPDLLADQSRWRHVCIDYHLPVVQRLWTPYGSYRVYLHRIFPCALRRALFHPHPWPSAMRIVEGTYIMSLGHGAGDTAPSTSSRFELKKGSAYCMIDPREWHSVVPVSEPAWSLMVTGSPWPGNFPKPSQELSGLPLDTFLEILAFFRSRYPQPSIPPS